MEEMLNAVYLINPIRMIDNEGLELELSFIICDPDNMHGYDDPDISSVRVEIPEEDTIFYIPKRNIAAVQLMSGNKWRHIPKVRFQ